MAPAALGCGLAVTVDPLRELTAAQLRQLDGEVGLVGTVMEATATLTVGPETAQLGLQVIEARVRPRRRELR